MFVIVAARGTIPVVAVWVHFRQPTFYRLAVVVKFIREGAAKATTCAKQTARGVLFFTRSISEKPMAVLAGAFEEVI